MLERIDDNQIAILKLNDPASRNALGVEMFAALERALADIRNDSHATIVLLFGEGAAFCAGFDLAAAAKDPALMAEFIDRLSQLNRTLRRMPQIVVAAVQGAAIAGGCAILSACDFVFVAPDAQLGYPVHRLGVSPAVTIPTLQQAIGSGAARSLLMSGELIAGIEAHRIGLASHVTKSSQKVFDEALAHCKRLAAKPPHALRVTKQWLNELDGSMNDDAFDDAAVGSAALAASEEARSRLLEWSARSAT